MTDTAIDTLGTIDGFTIPLAIPLTPEREAKLHDLMLMSNIDLWAYQDPNTEEVSVICPAPKSDIERSLGKVLSNEEYEFMVFDHSIARPIREGLVKPNVTINRFSPQSLPKDREFRGAWKLSGDSIVEDLERAKAIKLEKIRIERKPLLEALDAEFMQAVERDDAVEKARIVAEKQKLRDVTEPLKGDAVKSVDELRGKKIEDFLNGN